MSATPTEPTPISLLELLRKTEGPVQAVWARFVKLYTPLLFAWARRVGAGKQEAPDLVQDVFLVLAREMRHFRRDPHGRFRAWLWTILLNKWRDRLRQQSAQPAFADQDGLLALTCPDSVEELIEEEYRTYLIAQALKLMQAELPPVEWQACQEYVVAGRPAGDVARELGLTVNQVYLAKSRVLRRLRCELAGLLD